MKVQMRKTVRFKTGTVLLRGQVIEVEPSVPTPKYDRAHYKVTREHRWIDQPTFTYRTTNGNFCVWAADVTVPSTLRAD